MKSIASAAWLLIIGFLVILLLMGIVLLKVIKTNHKITFTERMERIYDDSKQQLNHMTNGG